MEELNHLGPKVIFPNGHSVGLSTATTVNLPYKEGPACCRNSQCLRYPSLSSFSPFTHAISAECPVYAAESWKRWHEGSYSRWRFATRVFHSRGGSQIQSRSGGPPKRRQKKLLYGGLWVCASADGWYIGTLASAMTIGGGRTPTFVAYGAIIVGDSFFPWPLRLHESPMLHKGSEGEDHPHHNQSTHLSMCL